MADAAKGRHRPFRFTRRSTPPQTLPTTASHPWLTADRGWVPAGALRLGEPLVTLTGATSSSGTVAWVRVVPGQADRYNLTVAHDHTYAVGSGQVVVHNVDCGDAGWLRTGTRGRPGGGAIITQDGAVPLTGVSGERGVPNPGLDLEGHTYNGGCGEVACASKAMRSIEMGTGGWQKGKPTTIYIDQVRGSGPCSGCVSVLHQVADYVGATVTAVWSTADGVSTQDFLPGVVPFGGNG